ncbi:hypothetical protein [Novosphingobium sp. FKTRR1]|uniref:hypothetical protein n=1 Tax=Novosphingobium sp. FKTRR1 TaxID=2879118 RepID=UPI001CF0709B|nr:hypothetical protein [Novosphingobium sp. FKTRR1]
MTTRKSKAKAQAPKTAEEAKAARQRAAGNLNAPSFRHGLAIAQIQDALTKGLPAEDRPDMSHYADDVRERVKRLEGGDLALASMMLAAQAMTLDNIFAETARRMAANFGEYPNAVELYGRIALKAQANSRATIEALVKLHQPREQTVRHVHVNEGAQAVIADQFHHHQHTGQGGHENAGPAEQPHATDNTAGTGTAGTGPALPSPNPIGQAMPFPSGEGCEAVQDARRKG